MAAPAIAAPVTSPPSVGVSEVATPEIATPEIAPLTVPTPDGMEELLAREKRWTWDELIRAYEAGLIPESERYELLEGRLYKKMPQKNPHFITISYIAQALRAVFGQESAVFVQAPVNESPGTHPEPDVMVCAGSLRDWDGRDIAPDDVLLAVEVSDTTLASDRGYKAGLYARLGFAELWIVDVNGRTVEVRQGPLADGRWSLTRVAGEGESLAVPGAEGTTPVGEILPRAQG